MEKFDDYQKKILTFMNPEVMKNSKDILLNSVLGLSGEAGETADKLKKFLFHGQAWDLEALDKEVGDAQFYIALYATARNKPLSQIAQMNVDKLDARYQGLPWTAEAAQAKRDQQTTNGTTPKDNSGATTTQD